VAEYINRPGTVFEFYEDVLKQCVFYGHQVLSENNRVGLINWFTEHGYKNYLMRRPEATHTSYSKSQKTLGIPTSGDVVRDAMIGGLEAYVVDAVGYDESEDLGGKLYFNHLVEDLLVFESGDWQKYDATVAAGLAVLATRKKIPKKEEVADNFQIVRRHKIKQ